jgi:enoyl-CoA hydratase
MSELVTFTRHGEIGVITIHNPPVNALSPGVPEGIVAGIEAAADKEVRAVVLIGSGRTFIAGADIREFGKVTSGEKPRFTLHPLLKAIEDSRKPVVMAIHGTAFGGGLEVAMAGHYRVAVASAQVGQPEVKLGIIPGYGGTQRLAKLAGRGQAAQLLITGEMIPAAEALRIGLVNQVVPQAELLATVEAIAKKVIANAPVAVKFCLEALDRGMEMEATLFGLSCTTDDMKEGTKAFLEKRAADFKGK